MKNSLLAVLTCLSMATAFAQIRLDSLRGIDPRPLTGVSAIWGYTAPDGREYAIMGITGGTSQPGGTSIVDITVDNAPREVAYVQGPNSTWREQKTYRHYAYIVTEAGGGVQIIDLSRLPDTARLVNTFNYSNGTKNIARSHAITISDGFMYLNGCAGWSPGGILIFDLRNDPLNPQFVGEYQPEYIHDCYVRNDTIYAAAINSGGGVIIADARIKSNVRIIGSKITYAGSGTHNVWVTKDRRYAISTDEVGSTRHDLKVWDIRNLPTVPLVPTIAVTPYPTSIVHNVTIRGDYAYACWYDGNGLTIHDVSNPASPRLVASSRTRGGLAWGIYPYFPSGKIIVADNNGLFIYRFSELQPRVAVRLLQPAHNDTVRSQTSTTFRWTKAADLGRDPHWYECSLRGPGIDTTWRANDTLSVFTNLLRLQNGQTYGWRVTARDEWNTTVSVDSFRFAYRPSSTGIETTPDVPLSFGLEQNYPNPFNPTTKIEFRLSAPGPVTLKIYNVLGKEVATLVDEHLPAGYHRRTLDAQNSSGLASGVYLYSLRSGALIETKRMVLIR